MNLLSNAYKYGGQPRRIEIAARANDREVAITVRDNGKGIARNEHKRIFEKFYRVDDLLARQQEGSGIGLAIVQHVMRAHRGRVEVDSAPGRGSAFTLLLRRKLPAEPARARWSRPSPSGTAASRERRWSRAGHVPGTCLPPARIPAGVSNPSRSFAGDPGGTRVAIRRDMPNPSLPQQDPPALQQQRR